MVEWVLQKLAMRLVLSAYTAAVLLTVQDPGDLAPGGSLPVLGLGGLLCLGQLGQELWPDSG